MKMKNIKSKVESQIKKEKDLIKRNFLKRKRVLERYIKGTAFIRFMDKMSFIIGVNLIIFTTFFLGRYPHNFFYTFHCVVVTALVALRYYNYRSKGWHYYFFDFCYFANTLIIYFLQFQPKSEILFKVFFVYANGPFGVAIPAFKNSMIFHKIDNLISLAIHVIPQLSSWSLRWHTIPYEANLPENERVFVSFDHASLEHQSWIQFLSHNFLTLFVIPFVLYLVWALFYWLVVFVMRSQRIKDRNYETMYIYYMNQPKCAAMFSKFGPRFAPVVFMNFHVLFFVVTSVVALLAYSSFYVHTCMMLVWITMSVWNGANFYMEYFSKKYEINLQKLEEIAQ